MRGIGIDELKQLQLEILVKVHEFCKKNNIDYFLGYGTLIGAVRHKGYIPWDDDIDIGMPRPSYDKFLQIFNGKVENLYVIAPELNWNYYAPYANICDSRTLLDEGDNDHRGIEVGVKIDVYPIDGVPENEEDYKKCKKKVLFYNRILSIKRTKKWFPKGGSFLGYVRYIFDKIVYMLIPYSYIQKRIYSQATNNKFSESKYVDEFVFGPKYTRIEREVFESYIDVDFEGYMLKTVKEYDKLLRLGYGDYMKLPPKEQQITHHNFHAFWKD